MTRRYGPNGLRPDFTGARLGEDETGARGSRVVTADTTLRARSRPHTSQSSMSEPYAFVNDFSCDPTTMAASEPPPPMVENSRLACLASKTSDASSQNCRTVMTVITSIHTYSTGMVQPSNLR